MNSLKFFACLLPAFLLMDMVWLALIMKSFYLNELGDLARLNGNSLAPRWLPAMGVYLMIPAGLVLFVRPKVAPNDNVMVAGFWGAVYGFILYSVYDLTNLSVLEKWTLKMTIVDIVWGTVLCAISSVYMFLIERRTSIS
jgi:uncharacterized membrane protein